MKGIRLHYRNPADDKRTTLLGGIRLLMKSKEVEENFGPNAVPAPQTISVDVEEYFHALNLEPAIPPARWHSQPSRVEYATNRLLEIFARHNTKGTFFVLGYVARRHPGLVRSIAAAGHEIGSHGYGHRLVYRQNERAFFRDIYRTKRLLEEIAGQSVLGYRAPNFSITDSVPWAHEALIRAGYRYDSSVYPTWHPRYANLEQPRGTFSIKRNGKVLLIFPLATAQWNLFGRHLRLPIAGGAYWRLFPRTLISAGLRHLILTERLPANCYLHPWEIDQLQPRFDSLSFLTKLRHYGGVNRLEARLDYFLANFRFEPFEQAYSEIIRNGKLQEPER